MTASAFMIIGVGASIVIGLLILIGSLVMAYTLAASHRWPVIWVGLGAALLLNGWWLAMAALVFVKFVILQEDT
jgi:hypothetical protein